jgi:diguanylate cyclase (GGDEF)-like protein/PAS domain S-box-containing protein
MLLRSIRSRLLGLVLATAVPFTALVGAGLWTKWQVDYAAAMRRAGNDARLLAAQVDDHIGNVASLLAGLSLAVSPDEADTARNDAVLRRLKGELPPYFTHILLAGPGGRNIGTTSEVGRFNIADRTYFRRAMAGEPLAIGDVIRGRASGEWVVVIARPVKDAEGRVRAVLAAATKLVHLQDALRVQDLPPGSVVEVLDQRGVVVARSPDGADWIGRSLASYDSIMRRIRARAASEEVAWPDGVERITGSATAHAAPWLVSVGLPKDVALADVRWRLRWAAIFVLVGIAAAFAIAWMLSGRIARPLRQLGLDVSKLAAGELGHRSSVRCGGEVGALADNVNRMAQALERRHADARAATEELQRARDTLAAVIDASPVAIVCSDTNRRLLLWSRGAEQIFGYQAGEVLGRRTPIVPPGEEAASQALFERAFRGETIRDIQLRRMRKDGTLVDIRGAAAPMYNADGTIRSVAWAYEDVTDRRRAEEQLRRLAHYDQLTGLPNRLSLQKELGRLLSGDRRGRPAAVALFDLDGFKDVNDTLGHSTGDELLVEVGQRLNAVAETRREIALVSRLGGDEFVVVVPNCGDPRLIGEIVDIIIKRLSEPYTINHDVLHVDASAGVAIAPNDGASVDELIANADLALYQAKSEGGRTCRFFQPALRAQAQARRGLDLDLRRAFAESEFELHFQPQVALADESVVGAEALLRWRHPERGLIGPGAFIDALAESPIANEVGRWIIRTACSRVAAWRARGLALRRIAVNLFPNQAHDETLVAAVEEALRDSGLPPQALEIEITENAAFNCDDPTAPLVKLHHRGVKLAFDDFGTGYASLNHLARFPVSRIKIDRSFVTKLPDHAEDAALVRSLIAMAHNLELEVIAEGVETQAQAAFLQQAGCREAQGFLYSRPLPEAEFEAYLGARPLALQLAGEKRRSREVVRRAARNAGRRGLRRG